MATAIDRAAVVLERFLAAPERPEGCLNFGELLGYLYAIVCSPEPVARSEWLRVLFNDRDPGYGGPVEGERVSAALAALHDALRADVLAGAAMLRGWFQPATPVLANLEADARLHQWANGFVAGHSFLADLWNELTPEELDDELGHALMVLSFFAGRELAEDFLADEGQGGQSLESMAESMLEEFPGALASYADIGRAVADAI
ncbi:MAG: UPF0149 family protein [Gammaproteobacteria bacterium]|nr:UPF0149 family protein [Gammaproteobacteria bacterium]